MFCDAFIQRERDRKKDRKTKGQKDRKTERQKERKTDRQTERETERERERDRHITSSTAQGVAEVPTIDNYRRGELL